MLLASAYSGREKERGRYIERDRQMERKGRGVPEREGETDWSGG